MRGYLRKGAGRRAKKRFVLLDGDGKLSYFTDASCRNLKGEIHVAGGEVSRTGDSCFSLRGFPIIKGVTQTEVKLLQLTAADDELAIQWIKALQNHTLQKVEGTQKIGVHSAELCSTSVSKIGHLMQFMVSLVDRTSNRITSDVFGENGSVPSVLVSRFYSSFFEVPLFRAAKVLCAVSDAGIVAEAIKRRILQMPNPLLPLKLLPSSFIERVVQVYTRALHHGERQQLRSSSHIQTHIQETGQELYHATELEQLSAAVSAEFRQWLKSNDINTTVVSSLCRYLQYFASTETLLLRFAHAFVPAFMGQDQSNTQLDATFLRTVQQLPTFVAWLILNCESLFRGTRGDTLVRTDVSAEEFMACLRTLAKQDCSSSPSKMPAHQRALGMVSEQLVASSSSRELAAIRESVAGDDMLKSLDFSKNISHVPHQLTQIPPLLLLKAAAAQCVNTEALQHIDVAISILQDVLNHHTTSHKQNGAHIAQLTKMFGPIVAFLSWTEACRTRLVCKEWDHWHCSDSSEAAELWQRAAIQLVTRDFGEEAIESLYLPNLHTNCFLRKGIENPWFTVAQRVAHCEYWQVPDDVHGNPCKYIILDISNDSIVIGAAALSDSRPLIIPRNKKHRWQARNDSKTSNQNAERGVVENYIIDIKEALNRLLGCWSWIQHAAGTQLVILEDKNPTWLKNKSSIEEAIRRSVSPPGGCRFLDPLACAILVTGAPNGIIIDGGSEWTRVLPVCSHQPQEFAASCLPNGGEAITRLLQRNLQAAGHIIKHSEIEELKRKHCYITPISGDEFEFSGARTVELSNGSTFCMNEERYKVCEVLFKPSLDGHDYIGLAEQVSAAIARCGIDTRRPLLSNVFILGGAFGLPGFANRLQKEIARACNQPHGIVSVQYHGSRTRLYPYLGACLLLENEVTSP